MKTEFPFGTKKVFFYLNASRKLDKAIGDDLAVCFKDVFFGPAPPFYLKVSSVKLSDKYKFCGQCVCQL